MCLYLCICNGRKGAKHGWGSAWVGKCIGRRRIGTERVCGYLFVSVYFHLYLERGSAYCKGRRRIGTERVCAFFFVSVLLFVFGAGKCILHRKAKDRN